MRVPGMARLFGGIRLHYDKLAALVALVALCSSLLYLAVRIGTIKQAYDAFIAEIDGYRPKYPDAAPVDARPYQAALAALAGPFQLPAWTNAVFVPEARVWCVDCRMPIPDAAKVCPICKAAQPVRRDDDWTWDGDGDGIPDKWEEKFGLDKADPGDARLDSDGDGFSNIAEFNAEPQTDKTDGTRKHGTDINDAGDFPPPWGVLFVRDITGTPFELIFKARMKLPDGALKFQLNLARNLKTVWAKLGETVEGFELVKYEERFEKRTEGGLTMNKDVSVLTLKRGEKLIALEKDQVVPYSEYRAVLVFALDGTTYEVAPGSEFTLKGFRLKVQDIDKRTDTVVLVKVVDGARIEVRRESAGAVSGAAAPP